MTTAETDKALAADFALCVPESSTHIEELADDRSAARPPRSDRMPREGGGALGRVPAATVGTAAVIAVTAARGVVAPIPTVRRSASCRRSTVGTDVLIEAVAIEPGPYERPPHRDTGELAPRASELTGPSG
ncbi:thioesterase [Streptomyces sp. NPDC006332]|uniref:thioesterase n=1 Tax=Streptomyces sp. NPDC006332 TaxID=3155456 RepID=UPI0033AC5E46